LTDHSPASYVRGARDAIVAENYTDALTHLDTALSLLPGDGSAPPMLATPANMRKIASGVRTPGAVPFAYSPRTFERFSAHPGDYWDMPDDVPLRDSEDEPMVLAFASETVSIVEDSHE
jgi:hypothetical protein